MAIKYNTIENAIKNTLYTLFKDDMDKLLFDNINEYEWNAFMSRLIIMLKSKGIKIID